MFNFGQFGRLINAIVQSIYVNPNQTDQIEPTPPDEYLRVVNIGSGNEYRTLNDGDYRSANT